LPKTTPDDVAKQEALVAQFIEENRPILEDPEVGSSTLQRMYVHGAELITPLGKKVEAAAGRATKAANSLTAAMNDPRCPAGTVNKREKEYKRLLTKHDRLLAAFNRLNEFGIEVKKRLDNEFNESGERVAPATVPEFEIQTFTSEATTELEQPSPNVAEPHSAEPRSWWQRIFGGRSDSPTPEGPTEPPEPSQPHSDREDYEKLLGYYQENLEVLEKTVATRQEHEHVYAQRPDMVERWQKTYAKLTEDMDWADRNMDFIEQRNADIATSELVKRRENLATRRDELETD
jgi:hypothetical protein